ncbi:MAG TPA: hypothetical protein VMN60_02205 [Longimicrobiales bacterium]|nr:hypothetical protein [Longimicrobiales bacterium]
MSHLSLEALARIVDDGANAAETTHLEQCATCRAELDAMQEDVHALRMLPDMTPAPEAWGALERRLLNEGLIRARPRAVLSFSPALQMAAALTLFLGGTIAGRTTAPVPTQLVTQAPPAVERTEGVAGSEAVQPGMPSSSITLASNNLSRTAQPVTAEEAAVLLRQTEELYLTALTRYAELTMGAEAGDPVARLAALQSIVMTTQAALNAAPADAVINGYHLTALAQRDATLRQVAAATDDRWY